MSQIQHAGRPVLSSGLALPERPERRAAVPTRPAGARLMPTEWTAPDLDRSAAEQEFAEAMRVYRQESGRAFPTWSEVLDVLRGLGYRKPAGTAPPVPEVLSQGREVRPTQPRAQLDSIPTPLDIDAKVEDWVRALNLRDKESETHTRRVTALTLELARALQVDKANLIHIRRGALLHDIGKLGIPDAILHKPEPLTAEEWEVLSHHPSYAYEWLAPIPALRPALEIPYCHHERWDGAGYPRGLAGEQIPLSARIFALSDLWDAWKYDRSHRGTRSEPEAREYLRSLAGTHLDPRVVSTFLNRTMAAGAAEIRGV